VAASIGYVSAILGLRALSTSSRILRPGLHAHGEEYFTYIETACWQYHQCLRVAGGVNDAIVVEHVCHDNVFVKCSICSRHVFRVRTHFCTFLRISYVHRVVGHHFAFSRYVKVRVFCASANVFASSIAQPYVSWQHISRINGCIFAAQHLCTKSAGDGRGVVGILWWWRRWAKGEVHVHFAHLMFF